MNSFSKMIAGLFFSALLSVFFISDVSAQSTNVAALENQMDGLTLDLRQSAESVLSENEQLTEENSRLAATLKNYREEMSRIQQQIIEAQAFLDAHSQNTFASEQQTMMRQQSDLEKKTHDLETEIKDLSGKAEELKKSNEKWRSQSDTLKAQKQSLLAYQAKELQYRSQEDTQSFTEQMQDWRKRVEALKARQDFLGKKIDNSRQAILELQKPAVGPDRAKQYRQLLRSLSLNGQSLRPYDKEHDWQALLNKTVSTKNSIPVVEEKIKNLGSGNGAEDLFAEQMSWVLQQAKDILAKYQKSAQDVAALVGGVDSLRPAPQALAPAPTLSEKEIRQIRAEIDRLESLKQKIILSEKKRLQGLLSDLGTENQILRGKIADVQIDIARVQGENETLGTALGSGEKPEVEKKIKANVQAFKEESLSPSQKPVWKTPGILQE